MQYSKGELRRAKTLELIKAHGKISLQEIIEVIGCSEATARRDLDMLEKAGGIIRTTGGAIYEGALIPSAAELPFAAKRDFKRLDKERIAEAAQALVQEGDVICLTGGTTTYFIAKALKSRRNITIVTNAVNIAFELADAEDIQVVVIGGVMRAKSYELIGPLAENVIEKINITKMFLGVDGVSMNHGFTMHSELEARIAQLMMERSSEVYAVIDQSKLEKSALFTITPLNQVTGVIMNKQPEGWFEQACQENQIAIYTPSDHTTSV
ncbi:MULTISPECIES: DeoR/GlpR family DNA-binding transcription regulator [Paenibacillus]|jgi:DeoR/GlpR family transcriptional regulator of sugar metabolism|uniref:DeoR/GlpR family DNA-binding transcription regulator n=1 Tax=Paenibacillus TaxID=44249 RepID=UPI00073EF0E8|nr:MULTISPECIES: DeoR/GlpR family DNA-binding transcription regulator [Paenibacillus]MDU4696481.1 DeoR/GlpR family DNA-binding transcription regulator [Paenibacillus sp.]